MEETTDAAIRKLTEDGDHRLMIDGSSISPDSVAFQSLEESVAQTKEQLEQAEKTSRRQESCIENLESRLDIWDRAQVRIFLLKYRYNDLIVLSVDGNAIDRRSGPYAN